MILMHSGGEEGAAVATAPTLSGQADRSSFTGGKSVGTASDTFT